MFNVSEWVQMRYQVSSLLKHMFCVWLEFENIVIGMTMIPTHSYFEKLLRTHDY